LAVSEPVAKTIAGEDELLLKKAPTGIPGLDTILAGGLPVGRPTLVCGSAGCGKTLFGMMFLVKGATEYDEPGVFVSFEEGARDLAMNVSSLGCHLPDLIESGRLAVDHIRIERHEIEDSGEYDLEGLFVRLGFAIDRIGAKRVVLDTIEALFSSLPNEAVLRTELRRLFGWLKQRGLTAVITAERGTGTLTRHGLEEYVSDCVILLDHRVTDQVTTRRLRVIKYRGSAHGTNEYPFLIDDQGFSVLPLTSAGLRYHVYHEIVSTGVAGLDAMLGMGGVFRGSSMLISGVAGSGKTILGASFAGAAAARGERSLIVPFEESAEQLIRNVASAGIDLRSHVTSGVLRIAASRPTAFGAEMHLVHMQREVDRFQPKVVVVDPITGFHGPDTEVYTLLLRLVDLLKSRGITTVFTSLTVGERTQQSDFGMSSLMDTWISLVDLESNGERNRGLYVLKSRGMGHSNQIREYFITRDGVRLAEVYVGPAGVLTGTARIMQEAREREEAQRRREEMERRQQEIRRRRAATERQIADLRSELEAQEAEMQRLMGFDAQREQRAERDRAIMRRMRSEARASESGSRVKDGNSAARGDRGGEA